MGGDLPPRPATSSAPEFVVSATSDPGTDAAPGAPLERLQIVKVWIADGAIREQVYDVTVAEQPTSVVDPRNCRVPDDGSRRLCGVWTDPTFSAGEAAVYYARVVEIPTCRWTAYLCNDRGVDCEREIPTGELAACCDAAWPRTIRERAWTSPIWYSVASAGGS
jgi:hypothetical protein